MKFWRWLVLGRLALFAVSKREQVGMSEDAMTSKEAEQAERRGVLKQDQSAREGSTLLDHSSGEEPAGRWAHQAPPTTIRSGPDYPKLASSSPWASHVLPDEPLIDGSDCK
jgi:hypothetical protein